MCFVFFDDIFIHVCFPAPRVSRFFCCCFVASYVGVFFAVATFTALMVMIWARHDGQDVAEHVVAAFIIAVTIVVVAIPEVR